MMTESEWLVCKDHRPMVQMARAAKVATPRRLALFACACCRMVWPCLTEEARGTVEQLERAAEGNEARPELVVCRSPTSGNALLAPEPGAHPFVTLGSVVEADTDVCLIGAMATYRRIQAGVSGIIVETCVTNRAFVVSMTPLFRLVPTNGSPPSDDVADRQADLVRDVFPYPFNRVAFGDELRSDLAPALTSDVLALAHSVYVQNRRDTGELDPLGLKALADALEEGGCTDVDVLMHLRWAGPHVRGCWALDLILGKS